MGDIDGLRQRVEAARRDYAALPRDGWGEPGPADEQTGERWDRGNVLGHVAEMVPFWTAQVRAVLDGSEDMGRDAVGMAQRRMGIDSGREAGEDGLLERIDQGLAGLDELLGRMSDADLERPMRYHPAGGAEQSVDLRYGIEHLLVGHLEQHLGQVLTIKG